MYTGNYVVEELAASSSLYSEIQFLCSEGIKIEYTMLLVEALHCKPEGCRFGFRWHHFHWHYCGSAVALESTWTLTKMSTRNISRRVKVAVM